MATADLDFSLKIKGTPDEIIALLGSNADSEIVHRDNMVLAPELKGMLK